MNPTQETIRDSMCGIFKTYGPHYICKPGDFLPCWKHERIMLEDEDVQALQEGFIVGITMNHDVILWLRRPYRGEFQEPYYDVCTAMGGDPNNQPPIPSLSGTLRETKNMTQSDSVKVSDTVQGRLRPADENKDTRHEEEPKKQDTDRDPDAGDNQV